MFEKDTDHWKKMLIFEAVKTENLSGSWGGRPLVLRVLSAEHRTAIRSSWKEKFSFQSNDLGWGPLANSTKDSCPTTYSMKHLSLSETTITWFSNQSSHTCRAVLRRSEHQTTKIRLCAWLLPEAKNVTNQERKQEKNSKIKQSLWGKDSLRRLIDLRS